MVLLNRKGCIAVKIWEIYVTVNSIKLIVSNAKTNYQLDLLFMQQCSKKPLLLLTINVSISIIVDE